MTDWPPAAMATVRLEWQLENRAKRREAPDAARNPCVKRARHSAAAVKLTHPPL